MGGIEECAEQKIYLCILCVERWLHGFYASISDLARIWSLVALIEISGRLYLWGEVYGYHKLVKLELKDTTGEFGIENMWKTWLQVLGRSSCSSELKCQVFRFRKEEEAK